MVSFKLARASYGAARGAVATISFALNVIETGAAEGTAIGTFSVEGFPTFEVQITDTQGGQVKVSGQGLAVGATAPNAATDPLLQPTGKIILPNGVERNWSLDLVVAGAVSGLTVTLQPLTKKFIATGSVLTAINAIANGNMVTIQHSTGSPIQVTYGSRYTTGDFVVPAPAAPYTGVEGTGGSPPDEETLTTAKPTLVPLTPWRQQFNGRLVMAFAGDDESVTSFVRLGAEGSYVDITSRSWWWDDGTVSGREEWTYAWVGEIDAANYTAFATNRTRGVQVWAQAHPVDPTWQKRLIGIDASLDKNNYKFFPVATANELFEYKFEITPSAGADSIPGAAYPGTYGIFRKIEDAMRYAAGKTISGFTIPLAAVTAKFVGTETATLTPVNVVGFGTSSPYTSTRGYWLFETETGDVMTIGRPGPWDTTSTGGISGVQNNLWRLPVNPVKFGKGIKFDHTYWGGFNYSSSGSGGLAPSVQYYHWWDLVETVCDWNMLTQLDDLGTPRSGAGCAFMTRCTLNGTYTGGGLIGRNNYSPIGPPNDLWTSSKAVYGHRVDTVDYSPLRTFRDAFTVQYSGAATDVYLRKTTSSGNTGGTIFVGTRTGGVDTDVTPGFAVASPARISDLVAYIDALPDWSAASLVTPNDRVTDRSPRYLCNSLTAGLVTTGNFKNQAITMRWGAAQGSSPTMLVTNRTYLDVHGDTYSFPAGGENFYYGFCQVYGTYSMQTAFLNGTVRSLVVENIFTTGTPNGANANYATQTKNKVTIRAVSDPSIDLYLAATSTNQWDVYSSIDDVVYNRLTGNTPLGVRPVIADSHGLGGTSNIPTPTGLTTGGTTATAYAGVAAFDNRPTGALIDPANVIATPSTPYDAAGMVRLANSPKGARGLGMIDGTYTKAQALQLAAYCSNNVTGTAVGTLAISGKAGAGETGDTVSTVISFNVAA